MKLRAMTPVLSAILAGCCLAAGCSAQAAQPESAPEGKISRFPEGTSQSQETPKEEDTAMEAQYADTALYRGTITLIDESGETAVYTLESYPGSGLEEQLLVTLEGADGELDLAELQLGDHLEVRYGAPSEDGSPVAALAVKRLFPAESVYYNGILVSLREREDGRVDLVMVPEGTPEDQWEDPMMQFIFHTGDQTQFYCDEAALEEGTLLNVYHRGTATMSIPPQGSALELRLLEGEG